MTADPDLGDLLRLHIDVLAELAGGAKTGSGVMDALDDVYVDPPSRSRVYQILRELEDAGLIAADGDGEYHNAVRYGLTEQGEVRVKEYAAHVGARVFD